VNTEEDRDILVGLKIFKESKINSFFTLFYMEMVGEMSNNMEVITSDLELKDIKKVLSENITGIYKVRQIYMYTTKVRNDEDHVILEDIMKGRALFLKQNKNDGKYYFDIEDKSKQVIIVSTDKAVYKDLYCLFNLYTP
jgi:hypothetical protein